MTDNRKVDVLSSKDTNDKQNGQFVAFLGHDLRNHLGAIVGLARLVMKRAELPAKQQENMVKLLRSTDQLQVLLDTMVDLAKLNSNALELQPANTNINGLISDVLEVANRNASEKNIVIDAELSLLPEIVIVDEIYLHKILSHLLDNAVRYTESDQIKFAVEWQKGKFFFLIESIGAVLSPQQLSALDKNTIPMPDAIGSGLGLPFCKNVISLMGGNLNLLSVDNMICQVSFELDLPVVSSDNNNTPKKFLAQNKHAEFSLPSFDVLQKLNEMALQGDVKALLEQTSGLANECPEFASEIENLAKNFQIKKICQRLAALLE